MNLREFINFYSPWNQPSIRSDSLYITHFFISNAFFNTASVLLNFAMNWALIVAYVLLRDTYEHQ